MDTRTALITGAGRGLGETLARFLAAQSWHLLLTARTRAELDAVATTLPNTAALAGDVTDEEHRRALVRAAGGRLDLLVNNASALGGIRPLVQARPQDVRAVVETNLIAPIVLVAELLPALRITGGLVVNVSSDAAVAAYEGWGVYGATKAALDLASLTLAEELRPQGVAVVSVDPGDMRTAMHQEAFAGQDISDRPLPEVTLPFWAWLLGRDPMSVTGRRFRAQAGVWEEAA